MKLRPRPVLFFSTWAAVLIVGACGGSSAPLQIACGPGNGGGCECQFTTAKLASAAGLSTSSSCTAAAGMPYCEATSGWPGAGAFCACGSASLCDDGGSFIPVTNCSSPDGSVFLPDGGIPCGSDGAGGSGG